MKKYGLLVILTLMVGTLEAEWYWQNPVPQGNLLMSVDFIDGLQGWAVGYCGTILKTDDGGASWHLIRRGADEHYMKIKFINTEKGWIFGCYGTVLKTVDGGSTWSTISIVGATINTAFILDENHIWAVGPWGQIYYSNDGGVKTGAHNLHRLRKY